MAAYRVVTREARDLLGEGPLWSSEREALFWVDIMAPALHCLKLLTGEIGTWAMPEPIGWIIERSGRRDFVVGLKSGFAFLTLEPFGITRMAAPKPGPLSNRLNDAKADVYGHIWAGTKSEVDDEQSGALYRLDTDLSVSLQDSGYGVANGPAFSLDGKTLYHSDSAKRLVYAFDINDMGDIGRRRVFIEFERDWGYPDGMVVDSAGAFGSRIGAAAGSVNSMSGATGSYRFRCLLQM